MHQPNSIRRYNLLLEPDTLHVLEFDLTSNVIDTSTWELEPDSVLEGYLRVHLEPPASSLNTLGFLSTDTMIMELELSPEMQSVSIEFTPEVSGVSLALTWYGAGVGVWVGIIEWSDIAIYRYVEPGHVQGESDNPFRFAGMYWDGHTSTYMTPNRHFSPRIGRWTQPDPFWGIHNMMECNLTIMQSGSLFMYVLHNPVRWIDPTGLIIELPQAPRREDFWTNRRYQEARATFEWNMAQYRRAIEYLMQSNTFRALYEMLQASPEVITIVFITNNNISYHFGRREIRWNPTTAAHLAGGYIMSPAMGLAHEMGHAAQHLDGTRERVWNTYRRTEARFDALERDNLSRFESPIARELGEFQRRNYSAVVGFWRVETSTDWGRTHIVRPATLFRNAQVEFRNENPFTPTPR